ncbi:unnamed protein product [Effrenium voratum]|nr:unnamed protein product [Effrenium voratum]
MEAAYAATRGPVPITPLARIPRWERRTAPVRAKSWRSHGAACAVALRSAKRILEETREPARVARARNALARRTRAARLVFCSLDQADVMACLRTMDLFGVQFAEVVGERKEVGDTSKNAKAFVTLQHWPDVRSCQVEMREAGYQCVAVDQSGADFQVLRPSDAASTPRLAIFFAGEQSRQEVLDSCDLQVRLPQRGFARSQSLGTSVALVLSSLRAFGMLSEPLTDEEQQHLWMHWLLQLQGKALQGGASRMVSALLAAGALNVWTLDFWTGLRDEADRQKFFSDLKILAVAGDNDSERTQAAMRARLLNADCPYGLTLPIDVTWPIVPDDVAHMVEPVTLLKLIAVVYSYLPLIPVFFITAEFLVCRGTRQLWILMWLGIICSVNEGIVKKLISEPRPGSMMELRGDHGLLEGSCVISCGMPSSHSAIAMGWFILSILDATARTHLSPRDEDSVPSRNRGRSLLATERKKVVDFMKKLCCLVPWVKKEVLTVREFISFTLFWFFLMVPVPFMRVVLKDHTANQAVAGSGLGVLLAMLWWRTVRVLQRRYRDLEGCDIWHGLIRHDYCLPIPERDDRDVRQNLELGHRTHTTF